MVECESLLKAGCRLNSPPHTQQLSVFCVGRAFEPAAALWAAQNASINFA
jgi:hypothetical protein